MPHHIARKQTEKELAQVKRYAKRYAGDLLLGYEKARANGYSRSYGCFKRTASKFVQPEKKRRKRKNKPYQRAEYPGQKLQIDVKFVPAYCVADGRKYYQFTAKDECTRWTYREMYDEHSNVSAKDFLEKLVRNAPFAIRMIQTDNRAEFTNALLVTKSKHKTLFEEALIDMGIEYHRIRIATPRHNGKVERQHRTDELRFYKHMRMYFFRRWAQTAGCLSASIQQSYHDLFGNEISQSNIRTVLRRHVTDMAIAIRLSRLRLGSTCFENLYPNPVSSHSFVCYLCLTLVQKRSRNLLAFLAK